MILKALAFKINYPPAIAEAKKFSKVLFICFLVSICHPGFSQSDSGKKPSSYNLDTLTISQEAKKTVNVHLRGHPSYDGLTQTRAVVSYVGGLPEGILKSVTFYFNCGLVNHLKKRLKINYKDVKLGLLIFQANADSTLGKEISDNEITFIVPADHRGPFKVDVSTLKVNRRCFFIGFSVLSKLPEEENNIYVRYNETKTAKTYVKLAPPFYEDWRLPFLPKPTELKLNLVLSQ